MNIYRRYFRITEGPIIDEVKRIEEINKAAHEEYKKILAEIGAKLEYYHADRELVGIQFGFTPDRKIYKNTTSGWYPKKNCKEGKQLAARFEAVKTKSPKDALHIVGLTSNPTIFTGGKCYMSTIIDIPEDPPVIYISTPWYDEDPEKIEQYKKDRELNRHFNSNLDAIRWEPTAEMIEIKKWERDRHIDEWNEKVRSLSNKNSA